MQPSLCDLNHNTHPNIVPKKKKPITIYQIIKASYTTFTTIQHLHYVSHCFRSFYIMICLSLQKSYEMRSIPT